MYKEKIDTKAITKIVEELEQLYKKAKFAHDTNNLKSFQIICKKLMKKLDFIAECYGMPFNDLASTFTQKNKHLLESYLMHQVRKNNKHLFE